MSLLVKAAVGPYREIGNPRSFRESEKTIQGLPRDPRVAKPKQGGRPSQVERRPSSLACA